MVQRFATIRRAVLIPLVLIPLVRIALALPASAQDPGHAPSAHAPPPVAASSSASEAFEQAHEGIERRRKALEGASSPRCPAGVLPYKGALPEPSGARPTIGSARNVILFVGDGMGVSTVTAARILEGQLRGETGEENFLSFECFPHVALSKTYNTNQQVPDSAGTMTAMMSGEKTKAGVLGVGPGAVRGDETTVPGNTLPTLFELAEMRGLSTGIVTTTRLTHATPAACFAHSPERAWEADVDLPPRAAAAGFPDLAAQLVDFPFGDGLEVALGGGRQNFLPVDVDDPEDAGATGRRTDGRDLTREWQSRSPRSAYVWTEAQLAAVDLASTDHLLGLFERSHMEYEHNRPGDTGGEPSLATMTRTALDLLSTNDEGFVLMVEGGRIDHAHHASNAYRSLVETIAFAEAVSAALEVVDLTETLILVTADHSHVFTLAGYPTRGNDILGKVIGNNGRGDIASDFSRDAFGLPFTALGYANGPGWRGERPDLEDVDTTVPGYRQEATVPLSNETHAGEDVAVYAIGPGAAQVHGVLEQHMIFYILYGALFR